MTLPLQVDTVVVLQLRLDDEDCSSGSVRAAGYGFVVVAGTATENQASGDIGPVENAAPVVVVVVVVVLVSDPAAVAVAVAFGGTSVAGVEDLAFAFVGPALLAYSVASSSFASSYAAAVADLAAEAGPGAGPAHEPDPVLVSELELGLLLHTCWDGHSFPPTPVVVFASSFVSDSIASPFARSLDCSWPGKRPRTPATIRTKIPAGHPSPWKVEEDYCLFETGYGELWPTAHHLASSTTTTSSEMWAHRPR